MSTVVILIVFCLLVVGLLVYTAMRMAAAD
jgi:hypothetical protein